MRERNTLPNLTSLNQTLGRELFVYRGGAQFALRYLPMGQGDGQRKLAAAGRYDVAGLFLSPDAHRYQTERFRVGKCKLLRSCSRQGS